MDESQNLLSGNSAELRRKAARCRQLAHLSTTRAMSERLLALAASLEREAIRLESARSRSGVLRQFV
jgi:hypothetical protein